MNGEKDGVRESGERNLNTHRHKKFTIHKINSDEMKANQMKGNIIYYQAISWLLITIIASKTENVEFYDSDVRCLWRKTPSLSIDKQITGKIGYRFTPHL